MLFELGNTGSKSTIQRYLKELNNVTTDILPPTVDDEVLSFVISLAERLTQHAQKAVAEERGQLDRQQATCTQERVKLCERLEQSLATIAHLTNELEDQRQCERQLREQLQDSDGERQGLRQVVTDQQQMLEERAAQMQSLEDKHRHAREALEQLSSRATGPTRAVTTATRRASPAITPGTTDTAECATGQTGRIGRGVPRARTLAQ